MAILVLGLLNLKYDAIKTINFLYVPQYFSVMQEISKEDLEKWRKAGKIAAEALEYGRKLNTGSKYDVQFSDLKKEYSFGTAIFDGAQVRHSYETGVSKLVFAGQATPTPTSTPTPTPTPVATKKTPAFEALLAISALLAVVLAKRR